MLFTKLNVIILFSKHSKVTSSSDMKKRKKIEKREDFCEMSDFINIYAFLNSKKTIFVCCSVRKHFIT